MSDKWTRVEDELPPLNVPVWLFLPCIGQPVIGCRSDDGDGWWWGQCGDGYYWDKDERVWKVDSCDVDVDDSIPTYWQYLPQPPEVNP
jgi:hypothetical protein